MSTAAQERAAAARSALADSGQHEALIRSDEKLRLERIPTESPEPGGLLIAVSFVGVCGTDLQILNGTRPDTAAILGHEGCGVVVRAAQGASLRAGEPVVFNPAAQLPAGRILGHNTPGLFQRRVAIDSQGLDDGLVLRAPDSLRPICGALTEPLASVIYAHDLILRMARDVRSVVVFGAGPIGLMAALYLRGLGTRVLLVHPDRTRLSTAIHLGLVDETSAILGRERLTERIVARNGGARLDAALICTTRPGAPSALGQATEAVRDGGCIDLVANFPEQGAVPAGLSAEAIRAVRAANVCGLPERGVYLHGKFAGRRIGLTGHRGTSRDHLDRAMKTLVRQPTRYMRLITHTLSLPEAAEAIPILAGSGQRSLGGRDCIKAVIDMNRPQSAAGPP